MSSRTSAPPSTKPTPKLPHRHQKPKSLLTNDLLVRELITPYIDKLYAFRAGKHFTTKSQMKAVNRAAMRRGKEALDIMFEDDQGNLFPVVEGRIEGGKIIVRMGNFTSTGKHMFTTETTSVQRNNKIKFANKTTTVERGRRIAEKRAAMMRSLADA